VHERASQTKVGGGFVRSWQCIPESACTRTCLSEQPVGTLRRRPYRRAPRMDERVLASRQGMLVYEAESGGCLGNSHWLDVEWSTDWSTGWSPHDAVWCMTLHLRFPPDAGTFSFLHLDAIARSRLLIPRSLVRSQPGPSMSLRIRPCRDRPQLFGLSASTGVQYGSHFRPERGLPSLPSARLRAARGTRTQEAARRRGARGGGLSRAVSVRRALQAARLPETAGSASSSRARALQGPRSGTSSRAAPERWAEASR
jgi:hypothetical protein